MFHLLIVLGAFSAKVTHNDRRWFINADAKCRWIDEFITDSQYLCQRNSFSFVSGCFVLDKDLQKESKKIYFKGFKNDLFPGKRAWENVNWLNIQQSRTNICLKSAVPHLPKCRWHLSSPTSRKASASAPRPTRIWYRAPVAAKIRHCAVGRPSIRPSSWGRFRLRWRRSSRNTIGPSTTPSILSTTNLKMRYYVNKIRIKYERDRLIKGLVILCKWD